MACIYNMPYYQLPTGKTIFLTIEQVLEMSDLDLQFLIAGNYGNSIQNPFHGSVITKPTPKSTLLEDEYIEAEEEDLDLIDEFGIDEVIIDEDFGEFNELIIED